MKTFIHHIYHLLRPYWQQVALALLTLLLTTGASLIIPNIIRRVIDQGLVQRDTRMIGLSALLVIGIGLGKAFLEFWQRYLSQWVAFRVSYDLRNRLYNHIQRLSFSYHDHAQTGQLISRCIEDVRSTNQFTGSGMVEILRIFVLITGITTLMFITNPRLALIAMLPMIPLVTMTTSFGKRISKLFYTIDQAMGDLSTRLQENITGAQVVRAFAREEYEVKRFARANQHLYDKRVIAFAEFAKIFPTTNLLVMLGTIMILWFGGQMVLRGEMTIGELVAFNAYLLLMAQPAQGLAWTVNLGGEAAAGLVRIFEVLDHPPAVQSPAKSVQLPALSGRVEFRQVTFRYEGETHNTLSGIHLTANPNQVIALIGPTGSGKTSLINLIPRFYDVFAGQVLVDGIDVREVNLESLRKQVGIVLQTSLLFSDTIFENIAFGRPEATLAAVMGSARAAQAHEFIMKLEDGYDTVVGERGITLSGGQRQRIAIARALLLNPRILILDDSTSSVDTETEYLIQQALDRLMEGRTTFVIAHRLSTVRRADLILVMENGQIVQRGTHEQLLHDEGLYREIYKLQLKPQEDFAKSL